MNSQEFSIDYKNERIYVSGVNGLYTLTYPGRKDVLIEQSADGWYLVLHSEKHWTDHDIATIGKIIEHKNHHA